MLGQAPQVAELLARDAGGAEALVRHGEQLAGDGRAPPEELEHAAVNRRRRLAAELLVDDRAGEVLEVRAVVPRGEATGTDLGDDARHHRIGGRKLAHGTRPRATADGRGGGGGHGGKMRAVGTWD